MKAASIEEANALCLNESPSEKEGKSGMRRRTPDEMISPQ